MRFGDAGTVEAAAFLTRVFKSVRGVALLGFSGLMLTCLEDAGMAAAAAAGDYDIRALLQAPFLGFVSISSALVCPPC